MIAAVDAGGSKTHAVVTDLDGGLLGEGRSGPGNHQVVGLSAALDNQREALDAALRQAGARAEGLDFVQFGMAGLDRPADEALLRPGVEAMGLGAWGWACDTLQGLRCGSPDYVGIVLVCGNGTNAAARDRSGAVVQLGGVGYLFGDGTGGSQIASDAFRAAFRSWEGREEPSVLTELLPAWFGFRTMEELRDDFIDRGVSRIREPGLAKVVQEAAEGGDALAASLLRTAGDELGRSAVALLRRGLDLGPVPVRIVLSGGVVQGGRSPILMEALKARVAGAGFPAGIGVEYVVPRMPAAFGSVLLARDALGLASPPGIVEKFENYGGSAS